MPAKTAPPPELPDGMLAADFAPRLEHYLRCALAVEQVIVTHAGFIDSTAQDGPGPLPVERSQFTIELYLKDTHLVHVVNGLAIARAVNLSRWLTTLAGTLAQSLGLLLLRRSNAPNWAELQSICPLKP